MFLMVKRPDIRRFRIDTRMIKMVKSYAGESRIHTDKGIYMPPTILKQSALFGYTPVEDRFITEALSSVSGDAVKVYLYALMLAHKGIGDSEELSSALSLSPDKVDAAYAELERAGALRIIAGENGSYAVQFIRMSEGEEALSPAEAKRYGALIDKLRAVLGTRSLSGAELKRIYDWIEVFRFEEDAAVEIVRHCISVKGARVHINYLDAVAKRLAADEMLTLDAVKASFEREAELSGGAAVILKRWRISRRPTEDELALYAKWTQEWGFSEDAVLLACTGAVSSDRPNFKYLDAILASYRESGGVSEERMRVLMREQDLLFELARQAFKRAGLKRSASAKDREQFELWSKEYAMEPEMILFAAELASSKTAAFAEMKRIITDWHARGIGNFAAAKEDAAKRSEANSRPENAAKGKRVNRALGYKQQHYTKEQLKALGIDFGEDVYTDED